MLVEEISDSETTDSLLVTVTGTWSNMRPVWLRGCATWSFGQKGPCEWGWLWRRDRGGGRRIKWRLIMPRSTLRTGVKPLPPLTTWPNDPPGQWPTWPPGPMHHMANGQLGQLAHDLPGARAMAMAHLPASSSMWPIALLMTWPPGSLFYSLFYSCFCCLWPLAYYGHYAHYAYRPNKQALRYNNIKYSCTLSYTLFGSIWSRQQNRPRQRNWPRQPVA